MMTYTFLLFIMMGTFVSSCKKEVEELPAHPTKIELTEKAFALISAGNDFGIDLYRETALAEPGNMMLSPLSANVALTMLLNGSGGATYEQLKSVLGYPGEMTTGEINEAYRSLVEQLLAADKKVTLTLANAVFYRLGFMVKPPFLDTMIKAFDAHIEALDFAQQASLEKINKWASDNTANKIPKVLDRISPATVMFLMNALYFKGEWSSRFDKARTTDSPFMLSDGSAVPVKTMHGEVDAITLFEPGYAVLEMPYGRKNFSMVVIVPDKPLHEFLKDLSGDLWGHITSSLAMHESWHETLVAMPTFKFDYEKVLNDQLMAMGMLDAFDAGLADFSGITDANIFVDFVKQNTFVEVNEEGTEAAAVTTIAMVESAPMPFEVNKPFVFAIRERTTNTLLFIGSVTNPR